VQRDAGSLNGNPHEVFQRGTFVRSIDELGLTDVAYLNIGAHSDV